MHLSALYRYPLKSGAGERLDQGWCGPLGLHGDRRWMAVDAASGRFLTQRALPRMALLQLRWQDETVVRLTAPGMPELEVEVPEPSAPLRGTFIWREALRVPDCGDRAAEWLSRFLGRETRLVYLPESEAIQIDREFAADGERTAFTDGFPFLLIGQSSLDDLCARVGRPLEMLRFRPSLVVAGSAPYAEDSWKRIRIGTIDFRVVKPCSRCAIPTIDPSSAERSPDQEPLATLLRYRRDKDGVFFGQNLIAEGTGTLVEGMPVEVLE
ncbi:MOSC domain-containing protein [Stutzerimonas nitrititolerans]|uniref:MOSC domain-containing protein n=1 Tax=Stutzerimonas nitrititolerans TaxID=2482751 RepID=UPI000F769539|nr:MOSC domain-containing protein [Stutzerimonas nitrititolerans]MBA1235435.1 MOSC domain-containing protein [Stutzerimonas stutzeri]RRV21113.1 MOSC domain-containing protein [Pseudomonas sp. s199]